MYDETIKSLRQCAEGSCAGCKNDLVQIGCRGLLQHEAADAIEELSKQFDNMNEANIALHGALPKWIPVTEQLPEHEYGESTSVLTVDLYGVMRVMYFDGGNWCWPSGEALTTMRVAPITHWMPLPQPPEEET